MKVIKAKTIITGDGKTVINEGAVAINESGKIEKAGIGEEISAMFPQAEVVEYGNATILPGLIDMHVHLGYWQMRSDKDVYDGHPGLIILMAVEELKEALSLGVTTLRTVTDPKDFAYTLKNAYKKGYISGPRFITSNVGITSTGGHGTQIEGAMVEANNPYEFRAAVREQIKTGADWIKLLASHRSPMCEITQEELNAAVDETHRWLKKCCVHAGTEISIEAAIEAGFDTIEHGTFMTVEQAKRAKEKGIAWVPTILPYQTGYEIMKKMIKEKRELEGTLTEVDVEENFVYFEESAMRYKEYFKQIADTGIKIAVGTDMVFDKTPITPIADEMVLMVKYGMKTLEAIKCATSVASEILELENEIGLLEEGYIADLLVVDGDAAENIAALKNVNEVYRDGKVVYSKNV
jgi:imidazolonepropionase-like amidohydrolase